MSLRVSMKKLVEEAERLANQKWNIQEPHHAICELLADTFDLYDEEGHLPVWLCRVVTGVICDSGNEGQYGHLIDVEG